MNGGHSCDLLIVVDCVLCRLDKKREEKGGGSVFSLLLTETAAAHDPLCVCLCQAVGVKRKGSGEMPCTTQLSAVSRMEITVETAMNKKS